MFTKKYIILTIVICLLSGCSARGVREAREVVAQAYEILGCRQWRYADAYAHACYHYGRLLREKDDPVAAMEAFINASHSHTHDYHILGRVYSNMGSICHLANEFPLSYDIYEKCADSFLKNGDTILYYYAMNEMAFELAEQGKKDETLVLLDSITTHYPNGRSISNHIYLTKAILYRNIAQYDSVTKYIDSLISSGEIGSSIYITMAQTCYYSQQYETAEYYARKTLDSSPSLFEKDNAYYILIRCDSIHSTNNIYSLNGKRADVEKEIEILHGKLMQAVQLLKQDLNHKPDWKWLYAVIITLAVMVLILVFVVNRRYKQHKLLSQQREDYLRTKKTDLEICCKALYNSKNLKKELDWDNYDSMCTIVNARLGGIADKLYLYPRITPADIRLCILVLLELSYEDMAEMLRLSLKSIAKLKSITAKKLGTTMKNLRQKLIQIACMEDDK